MATDVIAHPVTPKPITIEEFLELERNAPDDVHMELINGQIREYPGVTTRNAKHSETIIRIGHALMTWLENHPNQVGTVAGGEARCRLSDDSDTMVGLDVAYFEGEQHVHRPDAQSYFDGAPILAVEVLSLSDTHETVTERIRLLLRSGVKQVWIADPEFLTVTVHRSQAAPSLYSQEEELNGGPDLPGLKCPVAKLFGRGR
jgi:Uma2 family endonuclease